MATNSIRNLTVAAGLLLTAGVLAPATADAHQVTTLRDVRRATAELRDVDAAVAAGYGVLADKDGITCIDGPPGEGNMGIHYVRGDLVGDGMVDALHPEAVIYEPTRHGLRLTAVEYVVFAADWQQPAPPKLFGQEFTLVGDSNRYGLPAFYELHVWLWKYNPSGLFNDWNPRVSCAPSGHGHHGHQGDDDRHDHHDD